MHNLTATVAVLRDAETIVRSRLITDSEERQLLNELMTQLPIAMLPAHAGLIINAIGRYNDRNRKGPFNPEQGRPTEGKQDEAQGNKGSGEAQPEASPGSPEGQSEQAENAGAIPDGRPVDAAPPKASAPAQKPKLSKGGRR